MTFKERDRKPGHVTLLTTAKHAYNVMEESTLLMYFEESHPYFEIVTGPRNGKWQIENPKIKHHKRFQRILSQLLPQAVAECHPLVQRSEVQVRFVPYLTYVSFQHGAAPVSAECMMSKAAHYIRLSQEGIVGMKHDFNQQWPVTAAFVLLHELFEIDYHQKTGRFTRGTPDSLDYDQQEHEVIPNQRAVALIERVLGPDSLEGVRG